MKAEVELPLFWSFSGAGFLKLTGSVVLGSFVVNYHNLCNHSKTLKLGVDGRLHLEVLVQPAVVLFQGHHSVLKTASGLTDDRRLDLGWKIDVCKHSLGAVEKMEQELKSGIGCQMNAIILKVWCSETRKEIEVGRHVGREDLGELLQDLGQALAVPEGQGPVHWRSDEKSPIWMSVAEVAEDLANLEKHRLDSKSDSGSTAG